MRNLFLAAPTVATLTSPAAFADALTIGTAKTAPTFIPVSRDGQVAVDIGSANRAPVFAQLRTQIANVALAK